LITTSAIYSHYIRIWKKGEKKKRAMPKMMVRIYKKKTEVEKSSSMPTCQHHDNGSDHNTNDKYKAPRRRQILKCIYLCVCVTCTYIRTYLLPTPPPAIHIRTGWVECHGPYKRERPRSSSASVLSSPPFLGEARKNLSSFFQVFCTQILRDLFDRVGSRRYGRKHAKEIFINNCVQQPAAEVQALGSDP
jgi:hypothetical protein